MKRHKPDPRPGPPRNSERSSPRHDTAPVRGKSNLIETAVEPERALLVGIQWPVLTGALTIEYLDELDMLAQTAGACVVGREISKRAKKDPALLIGKGKAEELAAIIAELEANLVIFDEDLAPNQARNLEKIFGQRVLDRSGLILDIFARRARTRESRTQVELAQLRYLLPRLAGAWTHLERQRGGIGLRGPGETQIETDRRIVRTRISVLEDELVHIDKVHQTQRANRDELFRFALAGYTNVGKSTLMNALTSAGVYEENLLFATLDSTTRTLPVSPRRSALLSDTVGFIRKLPPALMASFRSTLAEIREANCILHIVDLASPSYREQMAEITKILGELEAATIPSVLVFNKIDALEDEATLRLTKSEFPDAVFISARKRTGIDSLLERMREEMNRDFVELTVTLRPEDGKLLSELHRVAEILDEQADASTIILRVRISKQVGQKLGLLDKDKRSRRREG
ncbi:GTPase HflX [candidate division KSB1 bacterium]|nr:GTPase HflX [candidate division KSB1 bacterium]